MDEELELKAKRLKFDLIEKPEWKIERENIEKQIALLNGEEVEDDDDYDYEYYDECDDSSNRKLHMDSNIKRKEDLLRKSNCHIRRMPSNKKRVDLIHS